METKKQRRRVHAFGNDWIRTLDRTNEWIWDGVIFPDAITLLSAPEKMGKTTLLSLLLDRRREGGQLLGRTVRPGVGRYPGTLQRVVAELNPEGTDYVLLPDGAMEAASGSCLQTLREILHASTATLTRQEILERWPEGESPPRLDSLGRALARACETGELVRSGSGTKSEAFRYEVGNGTEER